MNDKDKTILLKIQKYVADVESFTGGMTFEAFLNDAKTICASAFALGQIGELAKLVSAQTQQDNPSIPWHKLKGLRNRIVHDYESIDMKMLWATISYSLPELKELLGELATRS